MLNENKQRELAYVVTIDDLKPIEGKDRVECAVVGGWNIMVRKEQFKVGDPAIYFEIDSKVPETKPFEFLAAKKYKVKTQKYDSFYSQGLLMAAEDFGWIIGSDQYARDIVYIQDDKGIPHFPGDLKSMFLTQQLGVTYYDPMDRARKSNNSKPEYRPIFKILRNHFPCKQLLRTEIGRKILFKIFGIKKKKREWPWFIKKSDEERCQNVPQVLQDKTPVECSEKIDGTSASFGIEHDKFGRYKIYVCSRNVVLTRNSKAYYDDNIWFEMYDKYHIEEFLKDFINSTKADWVYLQGEVFGDGVQKRDYSLKNERDFRAFTLCTSKRVRYTYKETKELLDIYGIPTVPILDENYILPDSIEEVVKYAHGDSQIDGKLREGIVFRRINDPTQSFKSVDPEFLVKYHGG